MTPLTPEQVNQLRAQLVKLGSEAGGDTDIQDGLLRSVHHLARDIYIRHAVHPSIAIEQAIGFTEAWIEVTGVVIPQ